MKPTFALAIALAAGISRPAFAPAEALSVPPPASTLPLPGATAPAAEAAPAAPARAALDLSRASGFS